MRSRYYRQVSKVRISRLFVSGLICTMLLFLNAVDKIEAATLQDFSDGDSITNENVRLDNWDLILKTPGIESDRIRALSPAIGSMNPTFGIDTANMIGSIGNRRAGELAGRRIFLPNIKRVPIPGGVWLLSSGRLLLILVRRNNR